MYILLIEVANLHTWIPLPLPQTPPVKYYYKLLSIGMQKTISLKDLNRLSIIIEQQQC